MSKISISKQNLEISKNVWNFNENWIFEFHRTTQGQPPPPESAAVFGRFAPILGRFAGFWDFKGKLYVKSLQRRRRQYLAPWNGAFLGLFFQLICFTQPNRNVFQKFWKMIFTSCIYIFHLEPYLGLGWPIYPMIPHVMTEIRIFFAKPVIFLSSGRFTAK